MHSRSVAAALVAAVLVMPARRSAAAEDATLVRVFLNDGTSLVSYGEPARVGDVLCFRCPPARDRRATAVDRPPGVA
jgi:hypothetical protein